MHLKKIFPGFLLSIMTAVGYGQAIDNIAISRDINSNRYFRLNYENDYFSATDQYYTQGINLEFVHPALSKFPVSGILLHLKGGSHKYGLSVEHDAYTPTSISSSEILYGDRPFAACLFLKTFKLSVDTVKHQRLSAAFSAGVIGPYAGGENMQRSIHRWLGDIPPVGWDNQIQNDVILNYQLAYEKKIFSWRRFISFSSDAKIRAGTLNDKLNGGFTMMIGNFDSQLQSPVREAS